VRQGLVGTVDSLPAGEEEWYSRASSGRILIPISFDYMHIIVVCLEKNMHTLKFAAFIAVLAGLPLAQSAVKVIPETGPPTDQVALSGDGFAANENVDIYFDTAGVGLATTGPKSGFVGAAVTIPASAVPGTHFFTVVGQQSGIDQLIGFVVQTNWPQFHNGPHHHGYNRTENALSAANVGSLQMRWSAITGTVAYSSPAIVNDVLYIAAGPLYAMHASTGEILWTVDAGGFGGSPAVAAGVVYAGSSDYNLYAFDAATGRRIWKAPTSFEIGSSATVANGIVYVGSLDNLYAFNAASGAQIWSATTGGPILTSPAVAYGVVYVGSNDEKLHAFRATTGVPLWTADIGTAPWYSSPAVSDGLVYMASNFLYAFNAVTGRLVWRADMGVRPISTSHTNSSPAVANGVVYVGSPDHKLYAFDAATGQPLWSASTGYVIESSPAVANGVVYVGSDNASVYAFDAGTGKQLWSAATGNYVVSSPTATNGMLFVGSDKLYGFALPSPPR
jgi:outer membrane protein assembly factor BamB